MVLLPASAGYRLLCLVGACRFLAMGRSSAPPVNGKRIRQARLRLHMSQAEVCKACAERGHKLDDGNLSRMETGQIRWPALRGLPVLAEVLGVEVDDLWDTEDEPEQADAA